MRVDVAATGGWEVWTPHEVLGVGNGDTVDVPVTVLRHPGDANTTTVTLGVTSESDGAATDTATCTVRASDTRRPPGRG